MQNMDPGSWSTTGVKKKKINIGLLFPSQSLMVLISWRSHYGSLQTLGEIVGESP